MEYPVCGKCGSEDVVKDAWGTWNRETKMWELKDVFDQAFCLSCENDTSLVWKGAGNKESRADIIRRLNDGLRTGKSDDGKVMITIGVRELGPDFVLAARRAVAAFDNFNEDNDPHAEHDFGMLEVCGQKVFFKLDYYDRDLKAHSPDATDPAQTVRVLTIMLASEY